MLSFLLKLMIRGSVLPEESKAIHVTLAESNSKAYTPFGRGLTNLISFAPERLDKMTHYLGEKNWESFHIFLFPLMVCLSNYACEKSTWQSIAADGWNLSASKKVLYAFVWCWGSVPTRQLRLYEAISFLSFIICSQKFLLFWLDVFSSSLVRVSSPGT